MEAMTLESNGFNQDWIQKHFTKFVCSKLGFNDVSYSVRLRLLSIKSLTHRRILKQMKTLKEMYDDNLMTEIALKNNPRTGIRLETTLHRLSLSNKEYIMTL